MPNNYLVIMQDKCHFKNLYIFNIYFLQRLKEVPAEARNTQNKAN